MDQRLWLISKKQPQTCIYINILYHIFCITYCNPHIYIYAIMCLGLWTLHQEYLGKFESSSPSTSVGKYEGSWSRWQKVVQFPSKVKVGKVWLWYWLTDQPLRISVCTRSARRRVRGVKRDLYLTCRWLGQCWSDGIQHKQKSSNIASGFRTRISTASNSIGCHWM